MDMARANHDGVVTFWWHDEAPHVYSAFSLGLVLALYARGAALTGSTGCSWS